MAKPLNLHDFTRAFGQQIEEADKNRGLTIADLHPVDGSERLAFARRSYGEIRAADIYSRAHAKRQTFRLKIMLADYVVAASSLWGMFGLAAAGITGSSILATGLSVSFLGIGGAFSSVIRHRITESRFHSQFDPKTGRVNPQSRGDRTVAKDAARLLRRYCKDEKLARSLPYGEGLIKSAPVEITRITNQIDTTQAQPVPNIAARDAANAIALLGDPKEWNKANFIQYSYARIALTAARNPTSSFTQKDISNFALQYDDAYQATALTKPTIAITFMMGGLFGAPLLTDYVAHYTGRNAFAEIAANHEHLTTATTATIFLAVAAYLMFRSTREQMLHGKQDKMGTNAPPTPKLSVRAKRNADSALKKFCTKNGLNF